MHHLFIYGTLAPGQPNHNFMSDIQGTWTPAVLRGTLLQEGWGAEQGCPGIVPGDDGEEVAGFLFSSADLEAHWARLDAFEGDGYQRVPVDVRLEDGTWMQAHVYALNREAPPSQPV